jgi:hypothetical protein
MLLIDTSNFIVRSSGRLDSRYYIDYVGLYRAADISKTAKIDLKKLNGIYQANGGKLDNLLEIYYFNNMISAQKTISDIFAIIEKKNKGRFIALTEPEIAYIRNALINESGFAGINNKIKDAIFKKLNG